MRQLRPGHRIRCTLSVLSGSHSTFHASLRSSRSHASVGPPHFGASRPTVQIAQAMTATVSMTLIRSYASTASSSPQDAFPTSSSSRQHNILPRRRQIQPGLQYDWREEVRRSGSRLNELGGPLEDSSRTEEQRRRVAGWQPIVKLRSDVCLRVALVGRMNSGKSSVFNLLVRDPSMPARRNVVLDGDGVTRDSVEGCGELNGMHFTIMDTPGLVHGTIVEESFRTIETADVVVLVAAVDADVTAAERDLAEYMQRKRMPTLLLLNKMDLVPQEEEMAVVRRWTGEMGDVGQAIPVSVRRRDGWERLAAALEPLYHLHAMQKVENDWDLEDLAMHGDATAMEEIRDRNSGESAIRVAIVGRTNSGKSSLLNRLVGFERNRALEERNTTRDPVTLACTYKGRQLKLIDTAGLTRQRFRSDRDFLSRIHHLALNEIRFAHVVIVVFDATEGHPNKYDMSILHKVAEEGRPFLLCANKWDAVLDQSATAEAIDFKIKRQVKEVKYSQAVVVSAHTGMNLTLLMDQVLELYDTWNRRVRRSDLTKFWRRLEKSVIIPYHVARVGRISQVNTRPPTFLLQLQTKKDENILPRAMQEMMKNAIVEEFDFRGVPIRLVQEVKDSNPDYI